MSPRRRGARRVDLKAETGQVGARSADPNVKQDDGINSTNAKVDPPKSKATGKSLVRVGAGSSLIQHELLRQKSSSTAPIAEARADFTEGSNGYLGPRPDMSDADDIFPLRMNLSNDD